MFQENQYSLARQTNKRVLRVRYLGSVAACRVSALDREYHRKQRERHQGHPAAHVKALLALSRQRAKLIYKLLTEDGARYDKEILISSHLERNRGAVRSGACAQYPRGGGGLMIAVGGGSGDQRVRSRSPEKHHPHP